jgi:hypothetical protein
MLNRILPLCLLLAIQAGAAVPTPESHFGHKMGVDNELLDWDKVVSYFKSLPAYSARVKYLELGKTPEGRPVIAVVISSPANIKNLDHYRDIQNRLADPRKTPPLDAARLEAEGKAVVMITCSIHATEVASTHSAVEFAYRLLTEDSNPKFKAILENVIILLEPSENPDGVDIVTQWYRKTRGGPYDGTSPPEVYNHYVGHDNNRDWYIFALPETRAAAGLENSWHPQIVYDVHQMGQYTARMFVPPWLDPVDPNIDPLLASLSSTIGTGMATDLAAAGKIGVVINAMYDYWTPARQYQAYHGGARILTESASVKLATPLVVTPDKILSTALGYNPRERSWNYLAPWMSGTWRLRDIMDYQEIAFESLLYQMAARREDMLRYFYQVNKSNVERSDPFAFVIPADQNDPGAAKKMLDTLAIGEVEIQRASAGFTADGKNYPAGSYVIGMHQPYSGYAKTLLEVQHYPNLLEFPGGPPKKPYDVTAQTLPMLMGVAVTTVKDQFQAALVPAKDYSFKLDRPLPAGALAASDVNSWREVARIWKSGKSVYRDAATGDFYAAAGSGRKEIAPLRVGLYKSYLANIDEGWTRLIFDDFGLPYASLLNADIQAGSLRSRFDSIILPDATQAQIMEGHKEGAMPPEYTGGIGEKGTAALKEFVQKGGTLILLNHASDYASQNLDVKVTNLVSGVATKDFYSPGSLLNMTVDTRSPLAYGMPENVTLWSEGSPAWDAPAEYVVARYPSKDVLASGWLLGEKYLTGKAALLDVPMGSGHIIMFGMRPQYRGQSYQNYKLFFNAMAYH